MDQTITIRVDATELDAALKKLDQLVELTKHVSLASSIPLPIIVAGALGATSGTKVSRRWLLSLGRTR